jgi:hypothetical protein
VYWIRESGTWKWDVDIWNEDQSVEDAQICREQEGRARKGQGLELVMQLGSGGAGQERTEFHLFLVDHVHEFDAG